MLDQACNQGESVKATKKAHASLLFFDTTSFIKGSSMRRFFNVGYSFYYGLFNR